MTVGKHNLQSLFVLFFKYSNMNLKLALEYKLNRSLIALAIFCREMIGVVVMFLILLRFLHIRGWEIHEMLFLYSFLFLSYSLFVLLFAGIRDFDNMVHSGDFDRLLTRPLGLMYQIIAARIDFTATIGHGVVGIVLFMNTAFSVGIEWNLQNSLYYVLALIGGTIIQASLFLLSACFSFWAVKTENLRNLIFFNARRIAGYPLTFYPVFIQKLLIFVIPFSFVNYFPAQYFLKKDGSYWEGYLYLTPVVGALLFILVFLLWRLGVRSYTSTGNSVY